MYLRVVPGLAEEVDGFVEADCKSRESSAGGWTLAGSFVALTDVTEGSATPCSLGLLLWDCASGFSPIDVVGPGDLSWIRPYGMIAES